MFDIHLPFRPLFVNSCKMLLNKAIIDFITYLFVDRVWPYQFTILIKMSNDINFAKKSNKVLYCKSYEDIKFLFEKITKVPN